MILFLHNFSAKNLVFVLISCHRIGIIFTSRVQVPFICYSIDISMCFSFLCEIHHEKGEYTGSILDWLNGTEDETINKV